MTVTLLDGGMGQELVARAGQATSLWSVQSLIDQPELVRAVHDDYFKAGAEVATTNTYSCLPDRLTHHDLNHRLEGLNRLACQIAADSRDANGSGVVAGSLGPLGFSYQPEKAPPAEEAAEVYAPLARIHAEYVDIHILETMASVDQARGGLMGVSVTGKPCWLAVTVDEDDGAKLRSGESVVDLIPLLNQFKPEALLINCSPPEVISQALGALTKASCKLGAYANGFVTITGSFNKIGSTVDQLDARKDLGPEPYADFCADWIKNGADIIGGCCEVGPAHINELKQRFC